MSRKLTLKEIEESVRSFTPDKALERLYILREDYGEKLKSLIVKYEKKKESYLKEINRFMAMCEYEKEAYTKGCKLIAGIDEAGRGPLAGPVVAAAVILPENVFIEGLNDSKKLSEKKRNELFHIIREKAISVSVGMVDEKQIDEINILNAAKKAMESAVKGLDKKPDLLLIDAVELKGIDISQKPIIKGDALSISIAAASVIAKVTRDAIMNEMDKLYPCYGFIKHKGYGTSEHITSIKKYGICPIHRLSFVKNIV
ncbi:MAG: ribonuclease HII [Clostridiaceae bacterium]|nr:ribonuclease HII [Clostridiaceae bacterium]